jgi:hypothetical protein
VLREGLGPLTNGVKSSYLVDFSRGYGVKNSFTDEVEVENAINISE